MATSQHFNASTLLIEALHKLGANARSLDRFTAELVFDRLVLEPLPGEFKIWFYSNGVHIYTMSCPWQAGQEVVLQGFEVRVKATTS